MRRRETKNRKVKAWLEDNKIYFEIGVASLLSLMAIIISVQSNRIAKVQTEIARETALPHLEIRDQLEFNDKTKLWDNRFLSVYNRGGALTDFELRHLSFMVINSSTESALDSISLPIDNYYDWKQVLGDGQGLIFQINNDHRGAKEVALRDSLNGIAYFQIETYVRMTYKDILNETHVDYYKISPNKVPIGKEQWDNLNKLWIKNGIEHSFRRLTVSEIMKFVP